jgi:hypothetical protein
MHWPPLPRGKQIRRPLPDHRRRALESGSRRSSCPGSAGPMHMGSLDACLMRCRGSPSANVALLSATRRGSVGTLTSVLWSLDSQRQTKNFKKGQSQIGAAFVAFRAYEEAKTPARRAARGSPDRQRQPLPRWRFRSAGRALEPSPSSPTTCQARRGGHHHPAHRLYATP